MRLQTTSLYDRIRVREAVDLFAGYYHRAIPTATLLDEVSLTDKMNSYVSELLIAGGWFAGSLVAAIRLFRWE